MLDVLAYLAAGIAQSFYLDLNFIELALIAVFAIGSRFFLKSWFDRLEQQATRLAARRALCITLAFVAPILIRLALLPWNPAPQPWIADEFSHQLVADTLLHGRFANPPHPLWIHFETVHEIFRPTYASVYFPGPGLALAVGKLLGSYWAGVLLSTGAMCAALLWMLYGFFPARWALLGGALAVLKWGAFSYWVNSYWGGSVAALAGALVLGAYARVRRKPSVSHALVLGGGLVLLAYTRPFEGLVMAAPIAVALLWPFRRLARIGDLARVAVPSTLVVVLGILALGAYFKAITGSPVVMPYRINQQMYGWPLTLPWDHPKPVAYRSNEMRFYYQFERCLQYGKSRPSYAIRYSTFNMGMLWRFFLGPALTLPFLLACGWWRDTRIRVPLVSLVISGVVGFIIVAYPHYVAPATACSLAVTVQAIRHLRVRQRKTTRSGLAWSRIVVITCCAMLPIRAFVDSRYLPGMRPGHSTFTARGSDQGRWRAQLADRLNRIPGDHLVFVQYDRIAYFNTEWVYNEADIDHARIVWARDMGPRQNQEVLRYYPARKPWLVTPDDAPDALWPYDPARAKNQDLKPVDSEICPVKNVESVRAVFRPPSSSP